jgi:hypothetical protein
MFMPAPPLFDLNRSIEDDVPVLRCDRKLSAGFADMKA